MTRNKWRRHEEEIKHNKIVIWKTLMTILDTATHSCVDETITNQHHKNYAPKSFSTCCKSFKTPTPTWIIFLSFNNSISVARDSVVSKYFIWISMADSSVANCINDTKVSDSIPVKEGRHSTSNPKTSWFSSAVLSMFEVSLFVVDTFIFALSNHALTSASVRAITTSIRSPPGLQFFILLPN